MDQLIISGNVKITKFMGMKSTLEGWIWLDEYNQMRVENLKYHSSWDWLMPVVEKINSLGIDNFGEPCFVIQPTQCFITDGEKDMLINNYVEISGSLLLSAYDTVVQFIDWYNTNVSQDQTNKPLDK